MLLNFKNKDVMARIRPILEADCTRIAMGELPERAWETDIYVTRRCNMTCSYCYINEYFDRGHPYVDPEMEQLCRLIDKLSGRTYGLVILGGEPLIRQDLHEFLRYARQKDIPSIRAATNGTFVKRSMEALSYFDRLNISLDATRKREFPDVIEKMLIDVLEVKKEMRHEFPDICISYTLSQDEIFERDIVPVIAYAAENDFNIKFLPCKYPDKDVNWALLRKVIEQTLEIVEEDRLLNIADLTQKITNEFLFENCLQGMQFYIDFEGYFLYPCDEYSNQRVAKISDYTLDELYRMGMQKYGIYPNKKEKTCLRCKSYCHAENSYNYQHPERQLTLFS